jgi:hypothetical protein
MSDEAEPIGDTDLLLDVWNQWSFAVPGHPGWSHDGCLSTLEDVARVLLERGVLARVDDPDHDWYRRVSHE